MYRMKKVYLKGVLVLIVLTALFLVSFANKSEKNWFNEISVNTGIDESIGLKKQVKVTSIVINFGVDFKGETDTTRQNIVLNILEETLDENGEMFSYLPKTIVIYGSDTTGYNMIQWVENIGDFIEKESKEVIKVQFKK